MIVFRGWRVNDEQNALWNRGISFYYVSVTLIEQFINDKVEVTTSNVWHVCDFEIF